MLSVLFCELGDPAAKIAEQSVEYYFYYLVKSISFVLLRKQSSVSAMRQLSACSAEQELMFITETQHTHLIKFQDQETWFLVQKRKKKEKRANKRTKKRFSFKNLISRRWNFSKPSRVKI